MITEYCYHNCRQCCHHGLSTGLHQLLSGVSTGLHHCHQGCPWDSQVVTKVVTWSDGKEYSKSSHLLSLAKLPVLLCPDFCFSKYPYNFSTTLQISWHPSQIQQQHLECSIGNIYSDEPMQAQGKNKSPVHFYNIFLVQFF